ncbi:c-type cytochrome [Portibacter lacus]|uniref:c-type cytochrome n=1 Tax=Portibacter lacus TaxID=1099794 RepID=UPI001F170D02|nr:cytochrome c [Portibacter lacus]
MVLVIAVMLISINACQQPSNVDTGSEYMPDMAHSIAYEANTYAYYYNNTWGSKEDYYEMAQPRVPVKGTIARGAASSTAMTASNNEISVPANGAVPYYYGNTEEERTRASNELINNPYKITDAGLAQGKELYDIFCGICHGAAGDGGGYLVRDANPAAGDEGGKYPVQPANFLLEEFVAASNGRYYHAIEYGKNLMGSYKDKLSYEERWQVIHYIRSLQAKNLKLKYSQLENTLNSVDIPAGEHIADAIMETHDAHESDHAEGTDHESEGNHNGDH